MAVTFDYTHQLRNSYLLSVTSSSGIFESGASYEASTFIEHFRCLHNPGHGNNSSTLEWYIKHDTFQYSSFKWEYKGSGSTSWSILSTGHTTAGGGIGIGSAISGAVESTGITNPIWFRCTLKTSSTNPQKIYISNEDKYLATVRSVGTIST